MADRIASIDELFTLTLDDDYESDEAWDAVSTLSRLGTREIYDRAVLWCDSADPVQRMRGVDIISQFGRTAESSEILYRDETFAVLSRRIALETELQPLDCIITALHHNGNPRAVSLVAPFHTHRDHDIRFAVTYTLGRFPDDPVAVDLLILLSRDADEGVRDWATFGIGAIGHLDTPALREALVDRLSDPSPDVQLEAVAGLVRFKDTRVISTLIDHLQDPDLDTQANAMFGALEMLELPDDIGDDWGPQEYLAALRVKFTDF